MKCKNCGQTKSFKEILREGITQEIIYDDDYIVEEKTSYVKDMKSNVLICLECQYSHTEYKI
jgi:hypothetical protein